MSLPEPNSAVFSQDVRPMGDLKIHGSAVVDQVVRTHRPVLITRRGRGVAVILDLAHYEHMCEALAFGQAVDAGADQARRGEFAGDAELATLLGGALS